jgi:hypothetical protein
MTRKFQRFWLVLGLLIQCCAGIAQAEDFSVREVGLAFSLPTGWHYQDRVGGKSMMRRFMGPEGVVILHPTRPAAKTPEEALQNSVSYFTAHNPYMRLKSPPLEIVLHGSKPFVTASGLHGLQAFFGSPGATQTSTTMHYIPTPNGGVACICVEHCRSSEDRTLLENAIIASVRQIAQARKHGRIRGT